MDIQNPVVRLLRCYPTGQVLASFIIADSILTVRVLVRRLEPQLEHLSLPNIGFKLNARCLL